LKKAKRIFGTIEFDENFKVYTGGGCNSAVLTSHNGKNALIVDTMLFKGAKKLKSKIRARDITIINTHSHIDHSHGNKLYPGAYVIAGKIPRWHWDFDTGFSRRPDKMLKPGEEITIKAGNEKVHVLDIGRAHSRNDCVVYFENRKLLMAGDLVWAKDMHPVLMGSNINAWLWALKMLENKYEINTLVPGHGIVTDKSAIFEVKKYFNSIVEAAGDRKKLKKLRSNYKGYIRYPIISGIDKAAALIRKEKKLSY
jgi:cyclase